MTATLYALFGAGLSASTQSCAPVRFMLSRPLLNTVMPDAKRGAPRRFVRAVVPAVASTPSIHPLAPTKTPFETP